jgi:nucleotide-binding universal stress UspA family protein
MLTLQRILCPIDFSESSRQALNYAKALSSWHDARLIVLHVCVDLPVFEMASPFGHSASSAVLLEESQLAERRADLRRFVTSEVGDDGVDIVVSEGTDAKAEILKHAAAIDASLIVMGTHGRSGIDHVLLGSITEKVLHKAPCPILIVPPHAPSVDYGVSPVFKRIVCAIDFSTSSLLALNVALALAQEADARLTLLHAIEFPVALREVVFSTDADVDRLHAAAEAEFLRRLRALVPAQARIYCTVATRVNDGKPAREIERVAAGERADLIVMGVQGRSAVDLMVFGSNTNAVIRNASCPVLVVPTPRPRAAASRAN